MERMNTPGSVAWRCMRTRSPRMAPPVNGLEGSTAITPTVSPRPRQRWMSWSQSVDLPLPGGPVMPTTRRLAGPVADGTDQRRHLGIAILDHADRPGQSTDVSAEERFGQGGGHRRSLEPPTGASPSVAVR